MSSPLIISAYAVYPSPNNAEGVVNAAFLDALRRHIPFNLVTSRHGYEPLRPAGDDDRPVTIWRDCPPGRACLDRLTAGLRRSKWGPTGVVARLADRLCRGVGLPPLQLVVWSRRAADQIGAWQATAADGAPTNTTSRLPVVWARGTPPESFQAAILAYRRRSFPLVVNYNDPMPHCLLWGKTAGTLTPALDRVQHRQNAFLARHAQAFTFPCRRLAELMARNAGFDPHRCFVLPHLTPSAPPADEMNIGPGHWMLYAGSFYPAVFSASVRDGLARFARQRRGLRIVMALKKPSSEDRTWIATQLPGTPVFENLSPREMARLKEQAGAFLVADAPRHAPLLLTKVAEAVRACLPIFAITSAESTTADIVRRAGGTVVAPEDASAIADALLAFEADVLNPARLAAGEAARQQVAARFSEDRVVTDSLAVLDYACRRFAWEQAGAAETEPDPPRVEMWP